MLSMVAMGRMLRHLPDHYNLQKRETPRRSCESEMHTFLATESPKILRMALCGYVGLRSKVDPEAQSSLGNAYLSGSAGSQDLQAAAEWFRKAAMQGDAMAANGLGVVLKRGNGLDKQEAVKWFRIAAEKGDMTAQLNLGDCYYFAAGVEKGMPSRQHFGLGRPQSRAIPMRRCFLLQCALTGPECRLIFHRRGSGVNWLRRAERQKGPKR